MTYLHVVNVSDSAIARPEQFCRKVTRQQCMWRWAVTCRIAQGWPCTDRSFFCCLLPRDRALLTVRLLQFSCICRWQRKLRKASICRCFWITLWEHAQCHNAFNWELVLRRLTWACTLATCSLRELLLCQGTWCGPPSCCVTVYRLYSGIQSEEVVLVVLQ